MSRDSGLSGRNEANDMINGAVFCCVFCVIPRTERFEHLGFELNWLRRAVEGDVGRNNRRERDGYMDG